MTISGDGMRREKSTGGAAGVLYDSECLVWTIKRGCAMGDEAGPKCRGHEPGGHGRGTSSYRMQDPGIVFDSLALKPGDWFLDLGCGPGDYSIRASTIVGRVGRVYALDERRHVIEVLRRKIQALGLDGLEAIPADITKALPVGDRCIDTCLMATVFHVPGVSKHAETLFREIRRVLKPGGRLAIIECRKEDMPLGPPKEMRWSPEEIEHAIRSCDFEKTGLVDFKYTYLIQFTMH